MSMITWHPIRDQHSIDVEVRSANRHLPNLLYDVAEYPLTLSSIGECALRLGEHAWRIEKDKSKMLDYLRMAHLAKTWHWKAMLGDGPFEISLPGIKPFTCGRVKDNVDSDYGSWLSGVQLAMIFRDRAAMDVYLAVSYQDIVERDDLELDPWCEPYMNFLKGISQQDPNIMLNLNDALQKLEPSLYEPLRAEFLLNVLSPIMELWAVIFHRPMDQAKFDEAVLESQTVWHRFYGGSYFEASSYYEYMDKATLMAVIYAQFKGFKVNVKSDYLPEFLFTGDFPLLEWPDPEWKIGHTKI
jgi:hypothetical protein